MIFVFHTCVVEITAGTRPAAQDKRLVMNAGT